MYLRGCPVDKLLTSDFDRCIGQVGYIAYLKAGLVRVQNDPYDNHFGPGSGIDRNSPAIWDSDCQTFIHDASPVPVHSHNDYERDIPLFEALGSGCISVEADVHLQDGDLLVGHTASTLRDGSNLTSMYLEPLQRMVMAQNMNANLTVSDGPWRGLFNRAPQQTIVLLVDIKTSGPETFHKLHTLLQPLRELDYLTYWNGSVRIMRPLTIVASGNAPFQSVLDLDPTRRDIFWDAELSALSSMFDDFDVEPIRYGYNQSNSYFASTEFNRARFFTLSAYDNASLPDTAPIRDMMAPQIGQAKARGLLSRYWNTPLQPPNLREIVWRVLIENQVDILNMEDMGIVRARANGWGRQVALTSNLD